MIIFANQFAQLLAAVVDVPVFSDYSGVQDVPEYAVVTLDSSTELFEGSRTMQLEIVVRRVFALESLAELTESAFLNAAETLENCLSVVTSNFEKYAPLPGQSQASPLLLKWFWTPPEVTTESNKYVAEARLTIFVQF